jgi:DNA-binding NarL/FixJ family response regulator
LARALSGSEGQLPQERCRVPSALCRGSGLLTECCFIERSFMNILISLGSFLMGEALCRFLEREPESYRVVAQQDGTHMDDFSPDFILTDSYSLRKGVPCADQDAKVLLIDSGLGEEEITSLLLMHKIDGVLATTSDVSHLKKALQAVSEGQVWIDNRKVKALIHHAESSRTASPEESFSRKEREIIILVSHGLMNREIAEKLCISEQTVKTHISRIFRKAKVSRRSQLVPLALKFTMPDPA